MSDVATVRARPGGRVTLRFTGTGIRAVPRPRRAVDRVVDWFLGDLGFGVSLIALVVLGGVAAHQWQDGSRDLAVALIAACVPFAVTVLVRMVAESVGYVVLAGAVLLAPLLFIPGVRRWFRRWWRKETPSGRRLLDREIPFADIEPVSIRRRGRAVTVVLLVDDRRVTYTARDGHGDALERGFLSARGNTTGIGA